MDEPSSANNGEFDTTQVRTQIGIKLAQPDQNQYTHFTKPETPQRHTPTASSQTEKTDSPSTPHPP